MNHYAYRVYKRGRLNDPRFAGTVTANSMDDAAVEVIKMYNITVLAERSEFSLNVAFILDDEEVGIIIYANPEDFK